MEKAIYPGYPWISAEIHRSPTHKICIRDPGKARGMWGDIWIHWRHLRYQAQRRRGGDPWISAETKRSLATQTVPSAGDPGKPCYRSLIHCAVLSSQPKRSCPEPPPTPKHRIRGPPGKLRGPEMQDQEHCRHSGQRSPPGASGGRAGLGLGDILKRLPQGSPKNSLIAVARRSHISGGYTWLRLVSLSPASVPSNLRWYS